MSQKYEQNIIKFYRSFEAYEFFQNKIT